jgi:hypothetical protein
MTLRVDCYNVGAMRLYAAAGFVGLTETDADGVARACAVDMGDWLAALRLVEPRRRGLLGNTKEASRVRSILAMIVTSAVAMIAGWVLWMGAPFLWALLLLSLGHHSYPVSSPTPTVTSSAAP